MRGIARNAALPARAVAIMIIELRCLSARPIEERGAQGRLRPLRRAPGRGGRGHRSDLNRSAASSLPAACFRDDEANGGGCREENATLRSASAGRGGWLQHGRASPSAGYEPAR